jgi:uncharacterized protein DUF5677
MKMEKSGRGRCLLLVHSVNKRLAALSIKMVANSVGAVLLLGLNGYGVDAIKIARTMFEAAVTLAYLRKHPDEFDDYFDFHFVVAMKRHRYMEKYAPQHLKRVTAEAISSSKRGYARVSTRISVNGRVRCRWSKKYFSQICADLALRSTISLFTNSLPTSPMRTSAA